MAKNYPRNFRRSTATRRYRKLFIISAEGACTEPAYFSLFNTNAAAVHIECLRSGTDSAPAHVLKRMNKRLKDADFKATDEAWLVVDKDSWSEPQLQELHQWANETVNRGLALSNPNFEYWLLLHFEDGAGVSSAKACIKRLKQSLPNYRKSIDVRHFTRERINEAIRRARGRDRPPCDDWPRAPGATTVYRLVENLLRAADVD